MVSQLTRYWSVVGNISKYFRKSRNNYIDVRNKTVFGRHGNCLISAKIQDLLGMKLASLHGSYVLETTQFNKLSKKYNLV